MRYSASWWNSRRVMADVAIVGAGLVGMTAPALLAACGMDVVVLKARETTSTDPKAISIDDEPLRSRTRKASGVSLRRGRVRRRVAGRRR